MGSSKCGEGGYIMKMLDIFKFDFDNELVKTMLYTRYIRPLLPTYTDKMKYTQLKYNT